MRYMSVKIRLIVLATLALGPPGGAGTGRPRGQRGARRPAHGRAQHEGARLPRDRAPRQGEEATAGGAGRGQHRRAGEPPDHPRTYVHLGVVAIVGRQARDEGLAAFVHALTIRPDIKLTPKLSTPALEADLQAARALTPPCRRPPTPPPAPVSQAPTPLEATAGTRLPPIDHEGERPPPAAEKVQRRVADRRGGAGRAGNHSPAALLPAADRGPAGIET